MCGKPSTHRAAAHTPFGESAGSVPDGIDALLALLVFPAATALGGL
jgi:hypothetical protein